MKIRDNWSFRDDLKCYKVLRIGRIINDLRMRTPYGVQRDWIQSGCGVQWLTRRMDLILIIPFCSRHRISRTGHCVLSARSPPGPTMLLGDCRCQFVSICAYLAIWLLPDIGLLFLLITRYLVLRTFADNSTWLVRPCRMQMILRRIKKRKKKRNNQ